MHTLNQDTTTKSCCCHIESESRIFVMYRFDAEHPSLCLYTHYRTCDYSEYEREGEGEFGREIPSLVKVVTIHITIITSYHASLHVHIKSRS